MALIMIPEDLKIVDASAGPVTTNGGVTCDYVSLKHVHRAWILASFTQAIADTTGMDPTQSTVVAGTDVKAITAVCPIWANEDTATSDVLVRGGTLGVDAITFDLPNDALKMQVLFLVDPAGFDVANSFDVLGFTVDNSGQATNFVSVLYLLDMRYKQATPPSAIID